jgi:hypothetical protein
VGTVSTDRVIRADWVIQNHGAPGTFGVVSRDPTQTIYIDAVYTSGGSEAGMELVHEGDAITFDLVNIDSITVRAASYPTSALINFTSSPISLAAAPTVNVATASSSSSFRIDHRWSGASGAQTLYTPPTGMRVVVNALAINTDTAQEIVVYDNTNADGGRYADVSLAGPGSFAQSGLSDVSAAVGNPVKVNIGTGGVVWVKVEGSLLSQ